MLSYFVTIGIQSPGRPIRGVVVGIGVAGDVVGGIAVGVGPVSDRTSTFRANSEVLPSVSVTVAVTICSLVTPLTATVKLPLLSVTPAPMNVLP